MALAFDLKTPKFIPMRPDDDGNPIDGGYKCSACGLEGLRNNEPHVMASGRVCFLAPAGQKILAHAEGALLVREQVKTAAQPKPAKT